MLSYLIQIRDFENTTGNKAHLDQHGGTTWLQEHNPLSAGTHTHKVKEVLSLEALCQNAFHIWNYHCWVLPCICGLYITHNLQHVITPLIAYVQCLRWSSRNLPAEYADRWRRPAHCRSSVDFSPTCAVPCGRRFGWSIGECWMWKGHGDPDLIIPSYSHTVTLYGTCFHTNRQRSCRVILAA